MKTTIIALLFCVSTAFAQITKIDTHESVKTNVVEKGGNMLASAEIYSDHVEIIFFENNLSAHLFFELTIADFKQIGSLLQDYSAKDKDFYSIQVPKGTLFIRFKELNGYVGSEIYVDFNKSIWYFPKMNRVQYKRLFSM